MKTYPIMLVVQDRLAVVVGAGAVGLRKVRSLRSAGARVRLVAQDPAARDVPDGVEVVVAAYLPEHLAGAALVFACTDDCALNARIAADARRGGALVNAADQPDDCDFFLPAVVADGEVTVAIGTGGASPALAAMLKGRIRNALGDPSRASGPNGGVGRFAAALADLRRDLKHKVHDAARRGEILKQLADEQSLQAFLDAGPDALRRKMAELLREAAERPKDAR